MPNAGEIRGQVERESELRSRLAVPTFAGGVLFLLGTIISESVVNGRPTVGLLQGLSPALEGVANPSVSPRANEVKYISHHAFGLIAGSVLTALGIIALTGALLLLLDACRFRRPEMWKPAKFLLIGGGAGFALISILHQVVLALRSHSFAVGHDLTNHAVEQALTNGAANIATEFAALVFWLALLAASFAIMINSQRVGLLPRWVSFLGMISVLLIFLPLLGSALQGILPAFWMTSLGILYAGHWPHGMPEAWAAGEPRPWPTGADERRPRRAARARARRLPRERAPQAQPPWSRRRRRPAPPPASAGASAGAELGAVRLAGLRLARNRSLSGPAQDRARPGCAARG